MEGGPLGTFVARAGGRRRIHEESPRFSELSIPIDVIERLIRNLEKISPFSSKARPVLDEQYMIWFDQVTKTVNIQPTTEYNRRNSVEKVGIKIKQRDNEIDYDTIIYLYENSKTTQGVPKALAEAFDTIVAKVEYHVKVLEQNMCFNKQLLALFLHNIVKEELAIIQAGDQPFYVWTVKAPVREARSRHSVLSSQTYYLNVQNYDDYEYGVQFNKLGLGIDYETAEIISIMIDGENKPIDEIEALVFSPNAVWQKILKQILNQWLENRGIRSFGPIIKIHRLAIEIIPEKVLAQYRDGVNYITYLNDEMEAESGIDAGGLTNQFVTQLLQNLLDGGNTRVLDIGEGELPLIKVWSDKEILGKEVARNLGRLLNRILKKMRTTPICTGRVVPDSFFQILRYYAELDGAYPDVDCICKISKLATSEHFRPLSLLLGGDNSEENTKLCLSLFEMLSIELTTAEKQSDLAMKRHSFTILRDKVEPIMIIAGEIMRELNIGTNYWIKTEVPEKVSEIVQGKVLDKEDIISRISLPERFNTDEYRVVIDKIDFLKDHIRDPTTSLDWLEKFVFFVTAQKTLVASSKICINPVSSGGYCAAHTCFKTLDVPNTHRTPPREIEDEQKRFILNLEHAISQGTSFTAH